MKRKFVISVRGRSGAEFGFLFEGDPRNLDDWRSEGFEVYEVENTIPEWVVTLGLERVWCRAQDAWQWLRLW